MQRPIWYTLCISLLVLCHAPCPFNRPVLSVTLGCQIIRSPAEFETKVTVGSTTAYKAAKKYEQNATLWQLAAAAVKTIDPVFAERFTGLAITQGFKGSPHIDTTNVGPFYGLSFGDFADGTGGVRVEMDPMTVAEVNTKNRMGKVDGRYPHWVGPYSKDCERFSLIFYQTEGTVTPKGPAVFGSIIDHPPHDQ